MSIMGLGGALALAANAQREEEIKEYRREADELSIEYIRGYIDAGERLVSRRGWVSKIFSFGEPTDLIGCKQSWEARTNSGS